jgi:LssY C-terminus
VRSLGWSGTRDIGFSLTRFSFQITHATGADTNAERDCIVGELRRSRVIGDVTSYESGQHLLIERVNHYATDGAVSVAKSHGASGLNKSVCILVLQPTPLSSGSPTEMGGERSFAPDLCAPEDAAFVA